MKLLTLLSAVIGVQIMIISGCGGGGGSEGSVNGGSTTKTATLVFSSYSTNAQIAGFDFTVTLPKNVTITTDSSGALSSSVVYLSGQFATAPALNAAGVNYDTTSSTSNKLQIVYAGLSGYPVGEFLTVVCNVPVSYTLNINDISFIASFKSTIGNPIPGAYAKATFN
jgi:hypothetical protein